MESIINSIVDIYEKSDSFIKRDDYDSRQLALYITKENEFHLIACFGFGSHCATNSRYSNIADKQFFIWRDFDNNWKLEKISCDCGSFKKISKEDLVGDWQKRVVIKRPCITLEWNGF